MLYVQEKTASELALRGDGAAFSDAVRPRRARLPTSNPQLTRVRPASY